MHMDHAILSIYIHSFNLSMTACRYYNIRFKMFLEISLTGQCQTNVTFVWPDILLGIPKKFIIVSEIASYRYANK